MKRGAEMKRKTQNGMKTNQNRRQTMKGYAVCRILELVSAVPAVPGLSADERAVNSVGTTTKRSLQQ
jgi:hypothetical protein